MTRPRPRPQSGDAGARRDDGFTLLELMVALFLLAIVLLPFTQAFTATSYADTTGRLQQAAVVVADTALDQARAVKPADLVDGRNAGTATSSACPSQSEELPSGSTTALAAALAAINLYESPSSCSAVIPFQPTTTTLDGYTFTTYWYTGTCYQTTTSCSATAPSTGNQAPLYEVVVDVTWPQAHACPEGTCSYLASSVFSYATDPTFNDGPRA